MAPLTARGGFRAFVKEVAVAPQAAFSAPRRALAFLLVIPLALVAFLLAPSGAHALTEMSKYRFRGAVVEGFTSRTDECVDEFIGVFANEREVVYFSSTYNFCTDEGTFVSGSAAPTVFDVDKRLSAAHVVATIPLYDEFTGELVDEILIDNVWTATGPAVRTRSSSTSSLPGSFRFTSRFNGVFADATVTGTVPLEWGSIGKVSVMEVFFSRA